MLLSKKKRSSGYEFCFLENLIINGLNSYEALLKKSGLERLDVRRESAFKLLAKQMSESARYVGLFPLNPDRRGGLRNREKYKIYPARTSRFLSSPLNSMRRYLNEVHSS